MAYEFRELTDAEHKELVDKERLKKIDKKICVKPGQLLEFRDNIYTFKFANLGKLSLGVQGLRI